MKQSDRPKVECPVCHKAENVTLDKWEDTYICHACNEWFYPEEVGLQTDKDAGIFKIGTDKV